MAENGERRVSQAKVNTRASLSCAGKKEALEGLPENRQVSKSLRGTAVESGQAGELLHCPSLQRFGNPDSEVSVYQCVPNSSKEQVQ